METIACPLSGATVEIEDTVGAVGVIVICPGGGYEWHAPREMEPVGAAYRKAGYATAILRYTVGNDLGTLPVRELGWAVGLMKDRYPSTAVIAAGFSAGGHLAATLGVHAVRLNLVLPDALILSYPVITDGKAAHEGSFSHLGEGEEPHFFSLERWVDSHTPPTFIWHTGEDTDVPVENSLLFATALAAHHIPFSLHTYPQGVHGLSLATPEVDDPEKNRMSDPFVATWLPLSLQFLETLSTAAH